MIVIGLTGGIAMGKTTVAAQFKSLGVPTLDSDKVVHDLLAKDAATFEKIKKKFPACAKAGKVDRKALGAEVFGDTKKLKMLEAILHPGVWKRQREFLTDQRRKGRKTALLDIPLLFETGAEERCDYTVLATTSARIQKQRAMLRTGMSVDKFKQILARQMKDSEKRKRADFVVLTGAGKRESLKTVKVILKKINQNQTKRR